MRKYRDLHHANDGYHGQEDGVEEDHALGRIPPHEEQYRIEQFDDNQEDDDVDECGHGSDPSRTGVKVFFENVRPVD